MSKDLPACPVETTLMLIGNKWKVLIIRDLINGTKRFGELKKSIGTISQKVLTSNLRDMEESGLIKTGKSLKSVIDSMIKWGNTYKQSVNKE